MDSSGSTASTKQRRWLLAALVGYSLFLVWVLLWPSGAPATSTVGVIADVLTWLGVPESLAAGARVEFAVNAIMVAPIPFLVAALWPGWSWERWTAYGFIASGLVELVQGVFLPARSAQMPDVVANTIGVMVGAAAAQWWIARKDYARRD